MDHGINYRTGDVVKSVMRLTENKGVNLVVDPVGGAALQSSILSLAYRGRISMVGAAGREAMTAILWRASQRGEVEIARLTPMVVSLPVDLLRHELLFVAEGDVGEERLRQIVDDVFLPLVRA